MNRNKKNADDLSEIGIRGTVKAQFLNFMYNTAKTLINKKEELDFVAKILQVDDWKILNILYHNLVYYSLVQCFKSQKGKKKKKDDIKLLLTKLFRHYLLAQESKDIDYLNILKIICHAYRFLENWQNFTRGSSKFDFEDMRTDTKNIGHLYWSLLVSSTDKSNLQKYAKKFQQINCIKESLYLLQENTYKEKEKKG